MPRRHAARTAAVLMAGPKAGHDGPLVLSVVENGAQLPLPGQVDALAGKAKALVSLRRKPAAEKQLALLFWNYPAGEKNLSASHLNVPASIQVITAKLAQAGYVVTAVGEQEMIAAGQAMLGALYGSVSLEDLLARDLAEAFPVRRYTHWLKSLAPARRHAYAHGGDPAAHWAVRTVDGEPCFIIPRLKRGKLVIMPQMPRGRTPSAHYHDTKAPPDHLYMAAYLYVREHADAIVHLGTHGTQEWLPGKDRGLAADDDPFLAVGDVPVFYPYIQDNVGEALQARRRGRAVTVSHQTPPFARQGCTTSCAISITWCTSTRSSTKARHAAKPAQHWRKRLFRPVWRPIWVGRRRMCAGISTVSCLSCTTICMSWRARPCRWACTPSGRPPRRRIGLQPSSSSWASRSTTLSAHRPTNCSQRISRHWNRRRLSGRFRTSAPCRTEAGGTDAGRPDAGAMPPGKLAPFIARARALDAALAAPNEIEALLAGLEGRFVPPGAGGDPVRNLDVRSGRNLYAFEPDHLPTRAAFDAGREAFDQLIQAFRGDHDGAWPEKLAFSLWSSEAVRHLGVTEAQVLHALGLRPVWEPSAACARWRSYPRASLDALAWTWWCRSPGCIATSSMASCGCWPTPLSELPRWTGSNPLLPTVRALPPAGCETWTRAGAGSPGCASSATHRVLMVPVCPISPCAPRMAGRCGVLANAFWIARSWVRRCGIGHCTQRKPFCRAPERRTAAVLARSSNLHGCCPATIRSSSWAGCRRPYAMSAANVRRCMYRICARARPPQQRCRDFCRTNCACGI